jgi:hypothetical protein
VTARDERAVLGTGLGLVALALLLWDIYEGLRMPRSGRYGAVEEERP